MQLAPKSTERSRSVVSRVGAPIALTLAMWLAPRAVLADVGEVTTSHTLYHESPLRTNMTVYSPAAAVEAKPGDTIRVQGGWEADIVSGASVATKAGAIYQNANGGADVVTTASVQDVRNVGKGRVTVEHEGVTLSGGYRYGTENDYKSHAFDVTAKTSLFGRNTDLSIAYARNFDRVCDRVQGAGDPATRANPLESSDGCFSEDPLRTTRPLGVDTFQSSWTQAWTKIFASQLVYTAQIYNGFQSNPYRSVILAQGVRAQENHPENRFRHALTARSNLFVRPIKMALQLEARGYWDTWDIKSVSGQVAVDKYLIGALRLRGRARLYRQSGALFWSDDYTGGGRPLGPKGQYFTGDRELSPLTTFLLGIGVVHRFEKKDGSRYLGIFEALRLAGSLDAMQFEYDEYTLGGATISNARAYIANVALSASF